MVSFKTKRSGGMVDVLFTLALFGVFAASSLTVVLIGADVYKSTVDGMDRNFGTHTSLTYVASKVRQHDTAGSVYIGQLQGLDAVVLEQNVGGETYQTWIYHYDGYLRELFAAEGAAESLPLGSGQAVVEIDRFQIEDAGDGLIRLTAARAQGDGDSAAQVLVGVRSAQA